ncbi:MAG: hypothetical protein ACI8ZM_004865 [Crocinitomix sp.]
MKHWLIISICLYGLFSCSNEYEVEDKMFECFQSCFTESEIDIRALQDSLEYYLIQDSVLESGSGESYTHFLEKLSQPNFILKISKKTEDYFSYAFRDVKLGTCDCYEDIIDSTNYYGTTIFQLTEYQSKTYETWPNVSDHFKGINEILSIEDLAHPLYKRHVLYEFSEQFIFWNLDNCADPPLLRLNGYYTWDGPPDSLVFTDTLKFYMDTDYHIEVDGVPILFEKVSNFMATTIADQISRIDLPTDAVNIGTVTELSLLLEINCSDNTAYNSKCNLFEEIRKGYLVHHDQLALTYYNNTFNDLRAEQKQSILAILPVHTFPN